MTILTNLQNTHRPRKKVQRVGRGNGSKRGKTCCKGNKGDKVRSGYKRRYGYEGGGLPLYKRVPCRGFTNGKFTSKVFSINLDDLNKVMLDGEVVSFKTLLEKGVVTQKYRGGIKILSRGELKKKVTIEAEGISQAAQEKLNKLSIPFKIVRKEATNA